MGLMCLDLADWALVVWEGMRSSYLPSNETFNQCSQVSCALCRISRNIQYPVLTYVSNNLLNFRSRAQGYLMYCPAAIVRALTRSLCTYKHTVPSNVEVHRGAPRSNKCAKSKRERGLQEPVSCHWPCSPAVA